MFAPTEVRTQIYEETVKKTLFYSLLEGIPTQKIPLKMETMHLTILELNKYCSTKSDDPQDEDYVDKEYIIGSINATFRLLLRDGKWKPEYGTSFFRKLHRLNTLSAGKKNMAASLFGRIEEMEDASYVQEVVDAGLSARYLSKKTQKFMDRYTIKNLFEPIREILLVENGDDSKETAQIAMVKVSNTYFTDALQDAAKGMTTLSNTVMGTPVYELPILNLIPPIGGTEFQEITTDIKYIYMDSLRKFLLEQTSQKSSTKSPMQVTDIATDISGKPCTVSLGWVADGEKMIIKAITVSWDPPKEISQDSLNDDYEIDFQEPCFFVQPVNVPEQSPNTKIPFYVRPLYTLKRIPNSPYLRLEKVSPEMRNVIIPLIKQIPKPKEECTVECEIHTGISYEKEFMHVSILALIGIMLHSGPFRGAIRTFEKKSEDNEGFKITFRNDLEAQIVLVANEYLSSWYQPDLLKPLIAAALPRIKEEKNMSIIKERALGEFYAVERPGTGLLSWIQANIYNGNPDELVPFNADTAHETSKHIQFEECKTLLNAAFKTKQKGIYLPLVKAMVNGVHDIMKNRHKKEKADTGFIKEYFRKLLPKEQISEIMSTSESLDQKAARLIFTLFTEKSLGLEATEKQKEKIKKSLKLVE